MKKSLLILFFTCWALFFAAFRPVMPFAAETAAFPDGTPVTGGRILMGTIGEPSNLIPYMASDSASGEITGLLYVAPLKYDKDLNVVPWAAFIKEFVNKGHFDAIILAWTITLDPDIYDVWHSSRAKPGGLNFTGYRNAEVDELLVEARSMTDQDRRKELYDRVQEILDAEQPYCFLYVPYALPIVQARFQGIKPALNGIMYNFDRWWVPKDLQRYHVRP